MIGETAALALLERALAFSTAPETDLYLSGQDLALTRFAGNAIHQNVAHSNVTLNIRAVAGQRVGRATTNDLSDEGIRGAMESARRNALLMPEDPGFPGLPAPQTAARAASWDAAAAACSPAQRARMVSDVCRIGAAAGLDTAGACRTGTQETAVVSSRGVRAYHAGTFSGLIVTARSDTSAGWAKGGGWRLDSIDAPALGREAADRAVRGRHPQPVPPGQYPVVLAHYAVDDILEALSLYGMGAQAVQEGRSWMNGLQGVRAMSQAVSIWDDGASPDGWPVPFDTEGVPRRRVEIVTRGVVQTPVHNGYTAAQDGVASTGHQAYFTGPPIASNLFMQPGDRTEEELIAATERGLYITRFFYTRLSHNKGCVMTGMTRDGTFLIEGGELRHPVKDLRFTQSYVDALNAVEGVGREARLVLNEVGFATQVPALRLAGFNFTGVTV